MITVNEDFTTVALDEELGNENVIIDLTKTCCQDNISVTENRSIKESKIPVYGCTNVVAQSNEANSFAGNKNTAEGLMDIALLSANANQLRFLITYNYNAPTYYLTITLIALSLIMQIFVGIALIFKLRFRRCQNKRHNELILGGVFIITVVNILLAAFTTTDNK